MSTGRRFIAGWDDVAHPATGYDRHGMTDSLAEIYLHFVWATWDRVPMLTRRVAALVRRCIATTCEDRGCVLLAVGGTADHIHVLLRVPATRGPASIAHDMKGASSHFVTHAPGGDPGFRWQAGYAVFSVSPHDADSVIKYIKCQAQHHKDRTDEFGAWELPPSAR